MSDRPKPAAIVVPIHPFQRGEFDGFQRSPRSAPPDHFGLEEAIDRFRQRVVIAVAHAADGGLDTCLRQALGVLDRYVLAAADALLFVKS